MADNIPFGESFLHFVWKYKLFLVKKFISTANLSLEILHPGYYNTNAGPDFSAGKVILDGQEWVGNIEIHIKEQDWFLHKHHQDSAYDNTILHVVYELGKQSACRTDGTTIPTLLLKDYILPSALERYQELSLSQNTLHCKNHLAEVPEITINTWLQRMLVERLHTKAQHITENLKTTKGNWNEAFYYAMSRSFGFKVNEWPMETLANLVPLQLLAKYSHDLISVEALLFGCAGFLNEQNNHDEHFKKLSQQFTFLQAKHKLSTMEKHQWKFSKTRPQNFPSVRLAQFAALLHRSNALFSKVLLVAKLADLYELLYAEAGNYWTQHYDFETKTENENVKKLGIDALNGLIINAVVPAIYAYADYKNNEKLKQKAFDWLEQLAPEKNSIIQSWVNANVKVENSAHSQALLQLSKYYCGEKKCLNCAIGLKVLGR